MLFVECNADEKLVYCLGVRRQYVRHAKCKGEVLNRLRQQEAGIGLIDEDPRAAQPSELSRYREVRREGGLILLEGTDRSDRRVIVLCPRLEEWLYHRAAACEVEPQEYGLARSAHELKRIPRYETKGRFAEFVRQLAQSDGEVALLQTWLREFTAP
ncbi:hypothetical protein [Thermopirellula anaerolimosa]